MSKVGIVVEGESDEKILNEILKKLNLKEGEDYNIELPPGKSGGKNNMYINMEKAVNLFDCEKIIFLVDYDNSEKDAEKFKKRAKEIQDKIDKNNIRKKIYVAFAKQKIESWLLGCFPDILKDLKNEEPDEALDPVSLIENYKKKEYKNYTYNKISDGKSIAEKNELKHFEYSKSFKEFEKILEKILLNN